MSVYVKDKTMRVGLGYDIHRLVPQRKLVLGGTSIPYEKGLLGHSDADVLIHAICDALLGAAALGDIGQHFPDTDPEYKGVDSSVLLLRCLDLISGNGFRIENIDATIFAEAPKLSPYRESMQLNIARLLKVEKDRVSVKATTTEGLGAVGKGDGIGAMCIVLLEKSDSQM